VLFIRRSREVAWPLPSPKGKPEPNTNIDDIWKPPFTQILVGSSLAAKCHGYPRPLTAEAGEPPRFSALKQLWFPRFGACLCTQVMSKKVLVWRYKQGKAEAPQPWRL
jgi:hypothetical protein